MEGGHANPYVGPVRISDLYAGNLVVTAIKE
ncbi:hypothetical protein FHW37_104217 [Neorhizobium alkalisoli]|uniref:Uncharacterized protein n=1 Tax=Neorhizobium alkalisoli TaxID=528178 RepID=A0A561QRC2_9HYPH|nr:hypothetical protein FHW37_104217 [Neorhizobium alkalisoli]